MSEEEKKALETIKEELQEQKQAFKYYKGVLGVYSNGKVEILLNLIDKQQEGIDREKQYSDFYEDLCNKQQKVIKGLKKNIDECKEEHLESLNARYNNFISKAEIKDKISQLKEIADEDNSDIYIKIDAYEELLEEPRLLEEGNK